MLAVQAGHLGATMHLLAAHADVNQADRLYGHTALHIAAQRADIELVMMLIGHGARVSCYDKAGNSPLHSAAYGDKTDIAAALVDQDEAQLAARNKQGLTPLDIAAAHGRTTMVALLVRQVQDVDGLGLGDRNAAEATRIGHGRTPLLWAAMSGEVEAVRSLWHHGAKIDQVDAQGNDANTLAAARGALELSRFLEPMAFSQKAASRIRAFAEAAQSDSVALVLRSLDKGMLIDLHLGEAGTALAIACRAGSTHVTHLLLSRGASMRPPGRDHATAAHAAVMGNSLADLKLLLDRDPTLIDAETTTDGGLLHLAAEHGATGVATLLLARGCDPSRRDASGHLPLDLAAKDGHLTLIDMLLGFGSPLPASPPNGPGAGRDAARQTQVAAQSERYRAARAPTDGVEPSRLHVAAMLGNGPAVAALSFIDPLEARDGQGRTPLHCAADPAILRRLLTHDADCNTVDISGCSPVQHQARQGRHAEVALLLAHGAEPDRVDACGRTALFEAFERDDLTLFQRIYAATAKQPRADGDVPSGHLRAAITAVDLPAAVCWAGRMKRAQIGAHLRREDFAGWDAVLKRVALLRLVVRHLQVPTRGACRDRGSALHQAARLGARAAVVWLMENDAACTRALDMHGLSALSAAMAAGHDHLVPLMCAKSTVPAAGAGSADDQVAAALKCRNFDVWRGWLLDLDALPLDLNRVNHPLRLARSAGRADWVAELLRRFQAHPSMRRSRRSRALREALQQDQAVNRVTAARPMAHAQRDPGYSAWLTAQVRRLAAAEALPEMVHLRAQEAVLIEAQSMSPRREDQPRRAS